MPSLEQLMKSADLAPQLFFWMGHPVAVILLDGGLGSSRRGQMPWRPGAPKTLILTVSVFAHLLWYGLLYTPQGAPAHCMERSGCTATLTAQSPLWLGVSLAVQYHVQNSA